MGNEIAYLIPTKYKIFLGKGALPPYNPRQGASPQDPCEHLAHRLSLLHFKMEWRPCISMRKGGGGGGWHPIFLWQSGETSHSGEFKIGGSMESLVEMVQIENSLRNNVNFTLWNRFSLAFKTIYPWASGGSAPLEPRCHDGISDKNSTNWQFSAKLHVNFTPGLAI